MEATLAIVNAQIFDGYTQSEADTLLASNDKITAIGNYQDLKNAIKGTTRLIDAGGKFLMPAFIEGHGHFANLGYSKMKLDLAICKNWNEVIAMVANAATKTPKGNWIEGEGWHQEKWDVFPEMIDGFPVNKLLNKVAPNHPVVLWHATRHSAIVNKAALHLTGFNNESEIEGGLLLKDSNENLTGMLIENAINPVRIIIEQSHNKNNSNRFFDAIKTASDQCLKNGITLFQDADIRMPDLEKYINSKTQEILGVDIWMMLHESAGNLAKLNFTYPHTYNNRNKRITIGAIKRYMDGAVGNKGAWFLETYSDDNNTNGHCTLDIEEYQEICNFAAENNLQMATHAIGDKANRKVLQVYANTIQKYKLKDHRWRVEHAQHIHPYDIQLFAQHNILASVQTNHCTSDAGYIEKRLGKQRTQSGAYLWQTLLKQNIKINNGTDCPIESISPIKNFHAAVTRRSNGRDAFYPKECLSRLQALQAYTVNNAYAAKFEKERGLLVVGQLADLALLSQNLLTVEESDILNTKVLCTVKNGEVVYKSEDF